MKKDISLVLSGGAARGIAHIGAIKELKNQGYNIVSIAGNSMGAFVGAVYALNKLDEFEEWICNLNKKEALKLVDFSFKKIGFIKGKKIFKKIKSFIPDKNIEDLDIPYVAVASDITKMKEFVFSEGSIYDAVRASISIPSIFVPTIHKGSLLIDGGLVNPIPLNRVIRQPNDILVAVHVNAENTEKETGIIIASGDNFKKKQKKNKHKINYFDVFNQSSTLLTYSLSVMNIEKYKPDILIKIPRTSAGNFDFLKASELVEVGSVFAKYYIDSYLKQKNIL
ncbi:MAG: patatin-like phospholipase family protein [Bacteroidales bacterium]|nr:patatin-like phospholipase family protein [Bacteroidales bacterium]